MEKVKVNAGVTEGYEGIELEAAAVLASPGPLGIVNMGTLPSSLVAFGRTRRKSQDSLATCGQMVGSQALEARGVRF